MGRHVIFVLVLLIGTGFLAVTHSDAQVAGTAQTISNLNVRTAPGRGHPILGTIPAQSLVNLEGRNEVGDWVLVHTPDSALRGWVASRYLNWDDKSILPRLPVTDEVMPSQQEDMMCQLFTTPVVPVATARARAIYQHGLTLGNHPDRFSKVGDCQSVPEFFLGPFETGAYSLGDYSYLQATLDHFSGSFGRESAAVWSGFTIYSILDPTWSNPSRCYSGETPQACEYRLWKPSFVFISLEITSGVVAEDYEANLRRILDFWINHGVVPILGTKADNREGDWSINLIIARLAWEYDIPLWNFLMAAQPLPGFGVYDGFHLTFAPNNFDDPTSMESAWPWRNLTALQALDSVWRGVQ